MVQWLGLRVFTAEGWELRSCKPRAAVGGNNALLNSSVKHFLKNYFRLQWFLLESRVNAGATGSIPGWGNKILQAAWCSQKKIKKINKGN